MKKLLLINFSKAHTEQMEQLTRGQEITLQCCRPAFGGRTLGQILETGEAPIPAFGLPAFPGEMLVFAGFSREELDPVLLGMRQAGMTGILKAVLTPFNREWTLETLYQAVREENEVMRKLKG